jgi:N-acetylmuramoyl-L-alanine amidase
MKWIAALAVSASLLLAQSGSRAKLSVVAERHWTLTGVTRVAIEFNGEFQYHSDRLHNPERVYFDIPNAVPRLGQHRAFSEAIDSPLVKYIRIAETKPGTTRVVLDLSGSAEATASTLSNPNRLIIELRAGNAAPTIPTEPPAPVVAERPPTVVPAVSMGAPMPLPAMPVASPPPPVSPEETARAARPTASGENSLIRALGLKLNRVVIDPGHGGHDQGTEGVKGLLEKDLVLDVSKRLGKLVESRLGAEVIYTRSDDTFIPLEGRTALANERKADLFLSIHANSSPMPHISGVETFYLNITGSRDAMDVAARENAASQLSIFELQDIIRKITLHDKSTESQEFAHRIQSALYNFSSRTLPAKDRGVKSAPFLVLKDALMPSVLAEIGFLTNAREETLLKRPDYRDKLAEALYKGINAYAQSLSHVQVAVKP